MSPHQPAQNKTDLITELDALLIDLRAASAELIALTAEVQGRSIDAAKAERLAEERVRAEGIAILETLPERVRLVRAYVDRLAVIERCRAIWERARKPIKILATESDHGSKILAEFRHLPRDRDVSDFQIYVEYLEIFLQTIGPTPSDAVAGTEPKIDATLAITAESFVAVGTREQGDGLGPPKRGRGRPGMPNERKLAALVLKRSGGTDHDAAQALYDMRYPSKRECDNVYSILANFCRRCALDWPLPKMEGSIEEIMLSEVSRKPIIIFDTSGINNLAGESDFEALAAGIRTAYHTRLTGSNVEEIAATTKPENRGKLLDACQSLLGSGDCIDPFNWLIEKHVKAYNQRPEQYQWRTVDVRNVEICKEVIERTMFGDNLAGEQKADARRTNQSFEDMFDRMRPAFDEAFAKGTERPTSFAECVNRLQQPGGAFWTGYGQALYGRNVTVGPDEAKLRDFVDRCPPFRMMLLAAVKAQYERAIVEIPRGKKRAGRIDLLTAVYVPYCRVFVTHDSDQEACLREMAAVANVKVEILSYREFRSRLLGTAISV